MTLKCINGVRHEKHEDGADPQIGKRLLAGKRPDGAVEKGSSSFFAVPLPSLCLGFANLLVKHKITRLTNPLNLVYKYLPIVF